MTKNQKILASVAALLLLPTLLFGRKKGSSVKGNLGAFLKLVQWTEGTFKQSNPYAVTYAYSHIIKDFSDHPANTGEWNGYALPDSYCYNVGITPPCKSTAAGAYQFLRATWNGVKQRNPGIRFDQAGQDAGAIDLISRKTGALADIENGNLMGAINKVNTIWASLPGSPYGQPTKSYSQCEAFYISQGGGIFS